MPNTSFAALRAVAFSIVLAALTTLPAFAQQAEAQDDKLDVVLLERSAQPV